MNSLMLQATACFGVTKVRNSEAFARAPCKLDPTETSACLTLLPSLADERILPAATQRQERDQGKVHTDLHLAYGSACIMLTPAFDIPCTLTSASHMPALRFAGTVCSGLLHH